jgi:hypothetical protein
MNMDEDIRNENCIYRISAQLVGRNSSLLYAKGNGHYNDGNSNHAIGA